MAAPGGDALGGTLSSEKAMLGYYESALERSGNPLGKGVFAILAEDKRNKVRRLADICAALGAGEDIANACVLNVSCPRTAPEQFAAVVERFKGGEPPGALELELIVEAQRLEKSCLAAIEERLRRERNPHVRSFLLRALEEGRAHFVLLSDMKYHFEYGDLPA